MWRCWGLRLDAEASDPRSGCKGFLSQPSFWQEEGDAPILKRGAQNLNTALRLRFDFGWLKGHREEAIARAHAWLPHLQVDASRVDVDTTPLSSEGARIFRADANRTFRSEWEGLDMEL